MSKVPIAPTPPWPLFIVLRQCFVGVECVIKLVTDYLPRTNVFLDEPPASWLSLDGKRQIIGDRFIGLWSGRDIWQVVECDWCECIHDENQDYCYEPVEDAVERERALQIARTGSWCRELQRVTQLSLCPNLVQVENRLEMFHPMSFLEVRGEVTTDGRLYMVKTAELLDTMDFYIYCMTGYSKSTLNTLADSLANDLQRLFEVMSSVEEVTSRLPLEYFTKDFKVLSSKFTKVMIQRRGVDYSNFEAVVNDRKLWWWPVSSIEQFQCEKLVTFLVRLPYLMSWLNALDELNELLGILFLADAASN